MDGCNRLKNINTEVSLLISYSMPRQGHLEAALHIMVYLEFSYNSRVMLDPSYPDIDHSNISECNWKDFYEDVVEGIPPNALPLRWNQVDL